MKSGHVCVLCLHAIYVYVFITDGAGLGRRGCCGSRGDWTGVQDMFSVARWDYGD